MYYVYHNVPDPMVGTKLMPLNKMQGEMASTRAKNLKKYEGREEILEQKIPLLDCLWNDVVQALPFDPAKAFQAQKDMGIIPEIPHYTFYKIPLGQLDPSKTVIFFKTAPGDENSQAKWLKDVDFASIQEMPKETIEYYKTTIGSGELPFNYQFAPHVVYMGEIDISNVEIITL